MSLFAEADWLKVDRNAGYGPLPIPSPRDSEIDALLRAWLALDHSSRLRALSRIPESYLFTLLAYSERMASLAVRTGNKEHIVFGLLALGVDGWRFDARENILVVSLHYDAAIRIGVPPADLFNQAAHLLPAEPAKGLRSFLRRPAGSRSLEAMSYVAATDPDGFRYRRAW